MTPRNGSYLAAWMKQGYAVVATDYAGLGTPSPRPRCRPTSRPHVTEVFRVPSPLTVLYATVLQLNLQPVTFRTYAADHSGTMAASLPQTIPFVARLFR